MRESKVMRLVASKSLQKESSGGLGNARGQRKTKRGPVQGACNLPTRPQLRLSFRGFQRAVVSADPAPPRLAYPWRVCHDSVLAPCTLTDLPSSGNGWSGVNSRCCYEMIDIASPALLLGSCHPQAMLLSRLDPKVGSRSGLAHQLPEHSRKILATARPRSPSTPHAGC